MLEEESQVTTDDCSVDKQSKGVVEEERGVLDMHV